MLLVVVVVVETRSAPPHSHHVLEGDVGLRAAVNTFGDSCHGNGVEGAAAGSVGHAAGRP